MRAHADCIALMSMPLAQPMVCGAKGRRLFRRCRHLARTLPSLSNASFVRELVMPALRDKRF